MIYDTIIVGGAGAGLTAAIYAVRRNLKTLIITKDIGGQAAEATTVENYPGFIKISGAKLMEKFRKQAVKLGAEIVFSEVKEIKEKDGNFLVKADKEYESKTVILAFGKTPRSLNVAGEEKFKGKGVSYCANCDLPLFKNKIVAIVGGGNSALDAALLGSRIANKVYLIHRRGEFRGFESLVEETKKKNNIEFVLNSVPTEIKGDQVVKSLVVQNVKTNAKSEIKIDGIFIEIGSEVKTDFVKNLVKLDDKGQIIINQNCETSKPGVFAAGDVTNTPFKQIVVSAGEGCKAALQAYNYLHGLKTEFVADWAKKR